MDTFTNPVVTSRAAENHLNQIRTQHADIVQGIKDQAVRISAYNEVRQAKDSQIAFAKAEAEKERMAASSEAQKAEIEADLKRQELDIKRAALSE